MAHHVRTPSVWTLHSPEDQEDVHTMFGFACFMTLSKSNLTPLLCFLHGEVEDQEDIVLIRKAPLLFTKRNSKTLRAIYWGLMNGIHNGALNTLIKVFKVPGQSYEW